ncbi:MAG: hypothetical protein ACSHX4_06180 [Opitutaceae bacterium]
MKTFCSLCLLLLLIQGSLWGQQAASQTYLGYAYPSGGQVGDAFTVLLGGRYLNVPKKVLVSGEGVSVEVVKHYPALQKLNGERMKMVRLRMAQRESELTGEPVPKFIAKKYEEMSEAEKKRAKLPANSLFDRIEEMDAVELKHLKEFVAEYNQRQFSGQIAEQVALKVTIAKEAPLGVRELRLVSNAGLSNPISFQVSRLKELREVEPNDGTSSYSETSMIEVFPAVMNGQVGPGDIDRFKFRANRGQRMTFDLMARRLIPYVADAVPGWFQATLALYDGEGTRLAYVDDTYGDPDPSLDFKFENDGIYILEVRDAIYRGSENFVYRLFMSEHRLSENFIRHTDVDYGDRDLPFVDEREPNNIAENADKVEFPRVVVGRIGRKGDIDQFAFDGKAGEVVIAEVEARYFDSPMDSLLRLIGPDGEMLVINDDYVEKREHLHMGPGLMTHYADSYLTYELPKKGRYRISVEDVQRNGGEDYKYRLRLSHPIPNFEVRVSPSSLNVGSTGCVDFRVYVNRLDGFVGPIELVLLDPPQGMRLSNAVVPAGEDEVWATLIWVGGKRFDVSTIQLQASGVSGDRMLTRSVVPADNSMQAFLWRHLLPAQEHKVMMAFGYQSISVANGDPNTAVQLLAKKKTVFSMPLAREVKKGRKFVFRLKESPDGVELVKSTIKGKAIEFELMCSEVLSKDHLAGNLIVEVLDPSRSGPAKTKPIGVLPAIPFIIDPS